MYGGNPAWNEVVAKVCEEKAKLGYDPTLMSVELLQSKEKFFKEKYPTP